MPSEVYIASRTLLAVDPSGRESSLTLGIGQPYEVSREEWACPVCLNGLYERLCDPHGIDSWQSMQLANALIAELLGHFLQNGGTPLWPEGREAVALADLIPHLSLPEEPEDHVPS
jgi:hypothetical protein